METKLYVYDSNTLNNLKTKLHDYTFYSLPYFYNTFENLNQLDEIGDNFDKIVIDISNVIYDNFNRVFIERYILKLSEYDNICFCIHSTLYDKLINSYPFLFSENSVSHEYHIEDGEQNKRTQEIKMVTPAELYVYEKREPGKGYIPNKCAITLSNIIDDLDGIILNYDCNKIKEFITKSQIEYIDISSAVNTLNIRRDQIFYFEKLFLKILEISDINFCVEENVSSDTLKLFPLLFSNIKQIDLFIEQGTGLPAEDIKNTIDISNLDIKINNVFTILKGHDLFKNDFRHNLQKYYFLNCINERKIFSIIICGESGIGKTEFAKILSNELYPNEPLIKINFGNYSTEGVLNSLIGSPLGYVGSDEGGELINKINLSKSKVILIDEFERATPNVYNFFYELLEDGIFTDRHGSEHNLNGYIIIFTSNMSQNQYKKHIPNSLKSRFDMVYYFVDLPIEEKMKYIYATANNLINKLRQHFNKDVDISAIKIELNALCQYNNLREIKRKVEDVVFVEFFKLCAAE